MLVGNGVRLNQNPMRQMMAPLAGATHRAESMQAGAKRNVWARTGADRRSGVPDGLRHPSSWLMAPRAGGMSARNQVTITTSTGTLLMAAGRNMTGTVAVTLAVSPAALQLIVSAVGTAAITITTAGTAAGALFATGTSAVTITVSAATLGALVSAIGTAGVTVTGAATPRAKGWMIGSTVEEAETLTSTGVANAVWATLIEAGYDAAQILRLVMAAAGGEVTGAPGGPIEVLGLDGVTVRLTGDVDSDGNRTMVVVDAD